MADDELLARRRLVRLLAAMDGAVVAGECTSGNAVIERVREGGIDVILLDVRMPGLGGLEALSLLGEDAPLVILCTAHADHAVVAFEMGAVDYVMKPVEAGRLKKALLRAERRLHGDAGGGGDAGPAELAQPTPLRRLAIPTQRGIVLVDPGDISHAILDGELVTLVTDDAEYLTDDALSDLHDRLPRDDFARVHRRALVNLTRVARLEPIDTGGFLAHMRGGHRVEVSRQAARELRRRLGLR